MLIRAYGQFWNPDIVDWGGRGSGNRGTLMGKGKWDKRTIDIDSWDQHGIYILHYEFKDHLTEQDDLFTRAALIRV